MLEPVSELNNDVCSRHPGKSRDSALSKFSEKFWFRLDNLWLLETAGMSMMRFECKVDFETVSRTHLKITFVLKLHHLRHPGESRDPDFLENFANAGSRLSPG
jgi:hypothetical protein